MHELQNVGEFRENKLLAALPGEVLERISADLDQVVLPPFESLYEFNDPVTHLYFPHRSMVVSTLCRTDENVEVEVALTGSEGVVGLSAMFGGDRNPHRNLVQVPGTATRIHLEVAKQEFRRGERFQELLLNFTLLLVVQVSQTALCNRLHSDEERLSRWLLLSHDRAQTNQLPLPRELLAKMLGRNHSGVSITSATLQKAGLITYNGAELTIVDRDGLESVACSCYWVVKRQQQALFGT